VFGHPDKGVDDDSLVELIVARILENAVFFFGVEPNPGVFVDTVCCYAIQLLVPADIGIAVVFAPPAKGMDCTVLAEMGAVVVGDGATTRNVAKAAD
jgi:hypothetical protein